MFGIVFTRTEFPNLQAIEDAHWKIWRVFRQERISFPRKSLSYDQLIRAAPSDPVLIVQQIARGIAVYLQIPVTTIVVAFRSDIEGAGHVDLGPGYDFFIEIHERYRHNTRALAGILAHEVMHIHLHQKSIRVETTSDNEILTDTACYMLGLGGLLIGGWHDEVQYGGDTDRTTHHWYGYLSSEEAGYLLARRELHSGEAHDPTPNSALAGPAYEFGRSRAKFEFWRSPLWAGNHSRGWYRVLARILRRQTHMIERCPWCLQCIRIPRAKGCIRVSCPTCGNHCQSYT